MPLGLAPSLTVGFPSIGVPQCRIDPSHNLSLHLACVSRVSAYLHATVQYVEHKTSGTEVIAVRSCHMAALLRTGLPVR